jgi:hypothetical protein
MTATNSEPVPPVIYDQLIADFRDGRVPVDYRLPAPLDPNVPLEQDTGTPAIDSPMMSD